MTIIFPINDFLFELFPVEKNWTKLTYTFNHGKT